MITQNTMTSEFCSNNELMGAECVTLTVSAAASMIMRLITITSLPSPPPPLPRDAWPLLGHSGSYNSFMSCPRI